MSGPPDAGRTKLGRMTFGNARDNRLITGVPRRRGGGWGALEGDRVDQPHRSAGFLETVGWCVKGFTPPQTRPALTCLGVSHKPISEVVPLERSVCRLGPRDG